MASPFFMGATKQYVGEAVRRFDLLLIAVDQPLSVLADPPLSGASSLPHLLIFTRYGIGENPASGLASTLAALNSRRAGFTY